MARYGRGLCTAVKRLAEVEYDDRLAIDKQSTLSLFLFARVRRHVNLLTFIILVVSERHDHRASHQMRHLALWGTPGRKYYIKRIQC